MQKLAAGNCVILVPVVSDELKTERGRSPQH